jgi:hypothetical protein
MKSVDSKKTIKEYKNYILEELNRIEDGKYLNLLKGSTQIYAITAFLLLDNPAQLELFLKDMDQKIKEYILNHNIKKPDQITEVDNMTFFHVDLIFYTEKDELKRENYYSILRKWNQGKIHWWNQ